MKCGCVSAEVYWHTCRLLPAFVPSPLRTPSGCRHGDAGVLAVFGGVEDEGPPEDGGPADMQQYRVSHPVLSYIRGVHVTLGDMHIREGKEDSCFE
jgi:hypothetical protein